MLEKGFADHTSWFFVMRVTYFRSGSASIIYFVVTSERKVVTKDKTGGLGPGGAIGERGLRIDCGDWCRGISVWNGGQDSTVPLFVKYTANPEKKICDTFPREQRAGFVALGLLFPEEPMGRA